MATRILATLALGVLTTLSACGGGAAPTTAGAGATSAPQATVAAGVTAPPDGGGAVDVCSMLTVAEVKDVTGADTKAEVETTSGWADWVSGQCWWNSADLSTRFSIDVGTPASIAKSTSPTAQEQMEITRLLYQTFDDYADIPGLGDDALYGAGMVTAMKDGSMLQVAGLGLSKEQAIELAKVAIARL